MRTTMLVSLAACIAMLQCNLLLPTAGKTSAMFSVLDLMRLPSAFSQEWGSSAQGPFCDVETKLAG